MKEFTVIISLVIITSVSALLTSCAQVPVFEPSQPIEKMASWNDALSLCAEYRIRESENSAEIVKMIPWLRCTEKVMFRYPSSRDHEALALFFRELSLYEKKFRAQVAEEIAVGEWNTMVPQLLNWITASAQQTDMAPYKGSIEVLQKWFPDYANYLAAKQFIPASELAALKPLSKLTFRPEIATILVERVADLTPEKLTLKLKQWRRAESKKLPQAPECLKLVERQASLAQLYEMEQYRSSLSPSLGRLRVDRRIDEVVATLTAAQSPDTRAIALSDCLR